MTSSKKTFTWIGLALVAACAVTFCLSRFLLVPMLATENLQALVDAIGPSMLLLLTDLPNLIFLLVFWLVVRRIPKSGWQEESMSFRSLLQIFVMMYAVSSVFNLIGQYFTALAPVGENQQLEIINSIVTSGLPVGVLMTVVIAPVMEELIFRKLMLDRIRNFGEKTAIVFSAFCFGLYHGNLTQFLYAFSVGLFLGYVYCKTGKVVITMVMHALLNLLSSSIMLVLPLLAGGSAAMLVIIPLALLVIVMFIAGFVQLILHLKRKDLTLNRSMETCIPSGEVLQTVYLNPCVMLFVAVCTAEIAMDLLKISL